MSRAVRFPYLVLALLLPLMLASISSKALGQVRLVWSDGSSYLTGNAEMQAYYLFVPGGGNGTFDRPQTCQNFATYITVVNQTAKTLDFYANVDVGTSDACGRSATLPVRGSVAPHSSVKVRAMPDFWVAVGSRPGSPGINFTNVTYR